MDGVTKDVTDDFTDDITNDLARARHISDLIVNCCRMNTARNKIYELAFVTAFVSSDNTDLTGSCADLYITPGVKCIGDVDLMSSVKRSYSSL